MKHSFCWSRRRADFGAGSDQSKLAANSLTLLLPRCLILIVAVCLICQAGCRRIATGGWEPVLNVGADAIPNPLPVPMVPRELVMDEVSDEIDDYFRILREQRLRLTDQILTEGWIDTEPKIGSTVLEPWRHDSTPGFELHHATLQTVRRWAKVRVIPVDNRYLIDVKVFKELEDLPQPEHSTVSGTIYRHDNALDNDRIDRSLTPRNRGWIPMGRDFSLEQKILANIQNRIYQAVESKPTQGHH